MYLCGFDDNMGESGIHEGGLGGGWERIESHCAIGVAFYERL